MVARPRSSKSIVIFDSSGCSERASVSNSASISRTRSVLRMRRVVVVRINELVARIITAGVIIADRTPRVDSRFGREDMLLGLEVADRVHSDSPAEGRGADLGESDFRDERAVLTELALIHE